MKIRIAEAVCFWLGELSLKLKLYKGYSWFLRKSFELDGKQGWKRWKRVDEFINGTS